jgi:chemotaxis protein methyltransferase CheR
MEALKNKLTKNQVVKQISELVTLRTGNVFADKHKSMLEARLHSRMMGLEIEDWDEYYEYVVNHRENELAELDSLLTTHYTFFFREMVHYEFIRDNLPKLIKNVRDRGEDKIRIWSAACSRGHEVYSLAMYLNYYLPKIASDISFDILGTDIDHNSIETCENGVYKYDEVSQIPMMYLNDSWTRGSGDISHFAKIKTHLNEKCRFQKINLREFPASFNEKFDVILCRNVLIYFSPEDVLIISKNLSKHLHQNSFLISGLSEPLNVKEIKLAPLGSCVYTNTKVITPEIPDIKKKPILSVTKTVTSSLIKVFCVDDSGSVLKILEKMFSKENGYELVGTAKNGVEAAQKIPLLNIDVVTLDVHMPEMDGITYLEKYFKAGHPPVIMLTSVGKDEGETIGKAIGFGAFDHVEKPSLGTFSKSAEEIKTKIKLALENKVPMTYSINNLSYEMRISNPQNKWIIWVIDSTRDNDIQKMIKGLPKVHPPVFIISSKKQKPSNAIELIAQDPEVSTVYYVKDEVSLSQIIDSKKPEKICAFFSAEFTSFWRLFLLTKKERCIIFEEGRLIDKEIFLDSKFDQVPFTSFAAMCVRYLSR